MVFLKEKIKPCINASGRMTKLGVSTPSLSVQEAMKVGASSYFVIDDLMKIAGQTLADLLEAPSAVITSSASAGISLAVATVVAGGKDNLVQGLYDAPKKIVLPKGHNVDFGAPVETMIKVGGGICHEAGYANKCSIHDVEIAIDQDTVALMYVKSSHCVQKETLSIEDMLTLARKHKLPMILDCAAEIDFYSFSKMGIDYVIYSGSKALMGPTSGFVLVQSDEVATQMRKHCYGIGRGMKIGKEGIFGLVQAVYDFTQGVEEQVVSYDDLDPFIERLNQLPGIKAFKGQDESGREIYRAKVQFDADIDKVIDLLEHGTPQIFTRNYERNKGIIAIDPRPLKKGELEQIYTRIEEVSKHVEIL